MGRMPTGWKDKEVAVLLFGGNMMSGMKQGLLEQVECGMKRSHACDRSSWLEQAFRVV